MPNTKYLAASLRADIERPHKARPRAKALRPQDSTRTPTPPNVFQEWAAALDDNQLRYALAVVGGELSRRIK